jgi:hypothetical protein
MNFIDKYKEMGLVQSGPNSYYYKDQYSEVSYEILKTCDTEEKVPALSVWTKGLVEEDERKFQGIVSLFYNFIGNDKANNIIRESLTSLKTTIFREYTTLNIPKYTTMHNDILIQNQSNIPEVGDVYPQVTIRNSYDGKSGIEISFGLAVLQSGTNLRNSISFRNIMNSFKQIHSQHSKVKFTAAVGGFVEVVSSNILDFVKQNLETKVTDDSLLATLDMVEKIGERKRKYISDNITEILKNKPDLSCWDLFLAITKFSTIEKNLNSKILLEDIVEKTLVIPVQMLDMMKKINQEIV